MYTRNATPSEIVFSDYDGHQFRAAAAVVSSTSGHPRPITTSSPSSKEEPVSPMQQVLLGAPRMPSAIWRRERARSIMTGGPYVPSLRHHMSYSGPRMSVDQALSIETSLPSRLGTSTTAEISPTSLTAQVYEIETSSVFSGRDGRVPQTRVRTRRSGFSWRKSLSRGSDETLGTIADLDAGGDEAAGERKRRFSRRASEAVSSVVSGTKRVKRKVSNWLPLRKDSGHSPVQSQQVSQQDEDAVDPVIGDEESASSPPAGAEGLALRYCATPDRVRARAEGERPPPYEETTRCVDESALPEECLPRVTNNQCMTLELLAQVHHQYVNQTHATGALDRSRIARRFSRQLGNNTNAVEQLQVSIAYTQQIRDERAQAEREFRETAWMLGEETTGQ
ncbi:hypothetical protein LTR62_005067 [Meristemomyces frigidus]|uniref:Uncharacterized protein n=1 Tax=Meristemomyces frigidus TaxID=1508187 RepID=A0AAN7TWQ0_9PEZI|nr:hypothetical protein LTR62_005067 [Meristemomyces frigidus]